MKTITLTLVVSSLAACSSLQNAGMAEYTVKPMVIDKQTVCCEVSVKNGKEYASLKAKVVKKGDDYSVELEEQAVSAFAGQAKAADTVNKAIETAGTLGTSAIAAGTARAVGAAAAGEVLGTGLKAVAQ